MTSQYTRTAGCRFERRLCSALAIDPQQRVPVAKQHELWALSVPELPHSGDSVKKSRVDVRGINREHHLALANGYRNWHAVIEDGANIGEAFIEFFVSVS